MAIDLNQTGPLLENLRQHFIAQLPVRLASIEQCWVDYNRAQQPGPALLELVRLTHSLHGSAKTYGLMTLGDAASNLETGLLPWRALEAGPDPETLTRIDALVAALLHAAQDVRSAFPEPSSTFAMESVQPSRSVYLLENDPGLAERLAAQTAHFGYRVTAFATPLELLKEVERDPPVACILADAGRVGVELGQKLHRFDSTLPMLFASAHDDIEARLGAVKAGGVAYLSKPIDVVELVDALDRATGHLSDSPYRVLVVEDDVSLARYYRALLRDAGMEALAINNPLNVLRTLADFSPDLVLMDVYMPQCSGVDIAQVIRQHRAHGGLPIVFLSSEGDADIQYAALRTGGDDFLTKPVEAEVLLRTIELRAQRARQLASLMARDSLTGLLNHRRIKEMLTAEWARARRANAWLTIALLDLDHFKSIGDRHGYPAGDRVIKSLARLLRERLRGSDLVGRYGGEAFLMILPNCDRDSALRLIEDIRERFGRITQFGASPDQPFSAGFSAGLASSPLANSPENMLMAAEAALASSRRHANPQSP